MKPASQLTDLQIRLLRILWERGSATANEIHAELDGELGLARPTIGTLLHRLERQHVITHDNVGREFRYRALVSKNAVQKSRMAAAVDAFDGDLSALVQFAVSKSDFTPADLAKLQSLLRARKKASS